VRWLDVVWGVGGGVACFVLGSLAAAATERVFGSFDSAAGDALANADISRWVVWAFALCALVGAPLFEELCFRGLAFAAIAKSASRRGLSAVPIATIGSALLFALVHVEPVRIPVLLVIGLVLSVLRARTGRIGASVIAHSLNNFVAVLGILTASTFHLV
jgi:membrane protease YdiL (CAAX protease family)